MVYSDEQLEDIHDFLDTINLANPSLYTNKLQTFAVADDIKARLRELAPPRFHNIENLVNIQTWRETERLEDVVQIDLLLNHLEFLQDREEKRDKWRKRLDIETQTELEKLVEETDTGRNFVSWGNVMVPTAFLDPSALKDLRRKKDLLSRKMFFPLQQGRLRNLFQDGDFDAVEAKREFHDYMLLDEVKGSVCTIEKFNQSDDRGFLLFGDDIDKFRGHYFPVHPSPSLNKTEEKYQQQMGEIRISEPPGIREIFFKDEDSCEFYRVTCPKAFHGIWHLKNFAKQNDLTLTSPSSITKRQETCLVSLRKRQREERKREILKRFSTPKRRKSDPMPHALQLHTIETRLAKFDFSQLEQTEDWESQVAAGERLDENWEEVLKFLGVVQTADKARGYGYEPALF